MPVSTLPSFRYHPDPLATRSVVASREACTCCGVARGYVYVGPAHAVDEVAGVCPWCIADGAARAMFSAEFTDLDGAPDNVPTTVLEEIGSRTPGFTGWQQEHWLYHCGDGAAFLGRAGWSELEDRPNALAALRENLADDEIRALDRDGDQTAYLFRCRHCGTHLAYADSA